MHLCMRPSLLKASLALSDLLFFDMFGNNATAMIPKLFNFFTSLSRLSSEYLYIPGSEYIFSALFFPSVTKIGCTKLSTVSLVSLINFLIPLLFLSLLILKDG